MSSVATETDNWVNRIDSAYNNSAKSSTPRSDKFREFEGLIKLKESERETLNLFKINSKLFLRKEVNGFSYTFPIIQAENVNDSSDVFPVLVWGISAKYIRTHDGYLVINDYKFTLPVKDTALDKSSSTPMQKRVNELLMYPSVSPIEKPPNTPNSISSYLLPFVVLNIGSSNPWEIDDDVKTKIMFAGSTSAYDFNTKGYFFSFKADNIVTFAENISKGSSDPNSVFPSMEFYFLTPFSNNLKSFDKSRKDEYDSAATDLTDISRDISKSLEIKDASTNDGTLKELPNIKEISLTKDYGESLFTEFGDLSFHSFNVNSDDKVLVVNIFKDILKPSTPVFEEKKSAAEKEPVVDSGSKNTGGSADPTTSTASTTPLPEPSTELPTSAPIGPYDPRNYPDHTLSEENVVIRDKETEIRLAKNNREEGAEILKTYVNYWQSINNLIIKKSGERTRTSLAEKQKEKKLKELETKKEKIEEIIIAIVPIVEG